MTASPTSIASSFHSPVRVAVVIMFRKASAADFANDVRLELAELTVLIVDSYDLLLYKN